MNEVDVFRASRSVVALSRWIDESPINLEKSPEALTWHRVCKVAEEAGEVVKAMIGYSGGNPRKGYSNDAMDVVEELLDTAIGALSAVEHMTDNQGFAIERLFDKIARVHERAQNHIS
jgi:NTP pyrophosphatase (non-canonical NTP hydrolase)